MSSITVPASPIPAGALSNPIPATTFDQLIAAVAADAGKLAADQAAASSLTSTYNAAFATATASVTSDTAALAADSSAFDSAIAVSGQVVVDDNADGSYTIYEPIAGGQVVTKTGVSSKSAVPVPAPPASPVVANS